eukprot:6691673-Prymnesium_polylepis.1
MSRAGRMPRSGRSTIARVIFSCSSTNENIRQPDSIVPWDSVVSIGLRPVVSIPRYRAPPSAPARAASATTTTSSRGPGKRPA